MIVVEFSVDSPLLQEALARAPETTVSYEELYQTSSGINFLFWAEGDDLMAFEEGLASDPTLTNVAQLAETQTGRLYRVSFTAYGESVATFPSWGDLDVSLIELSSTGEGWTARMRMPDRETLDRYREVCEEKDLQFRLQAIYEEKEASTAASAKLTDSQREALITAYELGYFEIPRQVSMTEIADRCEVSSQAISERLRRGTATLIEMTLQIDS